MNIFTTILFAIIILIASGCAENYQTANSSRDMQRAHAEKAQGELSAEIGK